MDAWMLLCVGKVTVFEKCKSLKKWFGCSTLMLVNENSLKYLFYLKKD